MHIQVISNLRYIWTKNNSHTKYNSTNIGKDRGTFSGVAFVVSQATLNGLDRKISRQRQGGGWYDTSNKKAELQVWSDQLIDWFISICSTKEGFEGKRLNFSYISFTKLVYFRAIMLNCSHVAYAGVSISTTCLTNRRKLNEKCGPYLSAIMQKLW